jgi:TP901-1 family phage major tail protein
MTAFVGRKAILSFGSPLVPIAALRTKTMTLGNEVIDVTSDDDQGFRRLLDDPGTKTLDMSFEGVTKDVPTLNSLITSTMSGTDIVSDFSILFPTIGTMAGPFAITSLEIGAPYNEGATFSCSIQSAGAFTWTPIA